MRQVVFRENSLKSFAMKKETGRFTSVLAAMLLMALVSSARAAIYTFAFISSGMNATGTIDIVGGVAQYGSINVTGVPLEAAPNTFVTAAGTLLPANGPTDAQNHNGDVITYDNVVNLLNNPVLNGNGLGFGSGPYQDSTHYNTLINLWGNSPDSYTLFVGEAQLDGNGNVIDAEWVYHADSGSLTLIPVPEPATLALAGLSGLSLLLVRRQRT